VPHIGGWSQAHVRRVLWRAGFGATPHEAADRGLPPPRPRGRLKLNVRNLGEDAHDLVVRHDGRSLAKLAPVRPGATGVLRLTLRTRGRYELICTVADHAARGMRATLRVVS
jgi:hypothetical protein